MGEMRANSQVLLGIVNNMLEMARIEAGKMRVLAEPVDVVDLVNLVKAQMGFLADKKGVSLQLQVEQDVPIVLADSEKVRRICENLVSNAIKFTEAAARSSLPLPMTRRRRCLRCAFRTRGWA